MGKNKTKQSPYDLNSVIGLGSQKHVVALIVQIGEGVAAGLGLLTREFSVPGCVGRLGGRWKGECFREFCPLSLFQSSVVLSGKQDREAKLRARGILAPPPTPEHVFEQMSSEFLPFLNQSDTVPQDLLNE